MATPAAMPKQTIKLFTAINIPLILWLHKFDAIYEVNDIELQVPQPWINLPSMNINRD